MAVFLSRCIAHSEKSALACWCRWAALLLAPASPLPASQGAGCAVRHRIGDQVRCGQRLVPLGLGLPSLMPEAPGEEPTRSHAVAPMKKSRRGSRGERDAGERTQGAATACRGSTTRKVTQRLSTGPAGKSSGSSTAPIRGSHYVMQRHGGGVQPQGASGGGKRDSGKRRWNIENSSAITPNTSQLASTPRTPPVSQSGPENVASSNRVSTG